jgi:hypothetical protein
VERDARTKLNVKPSKVFQKDEVLSELLTATQDAQSTSERSSITEVYQYLTACNKMFERGLLTKYPVRSDTDQVMIRIKEGYQYFVEWHQCIKAINCDDSWSFIAWQTWDLLRILISGSLSLVRDFTSQYPNNFVVLARLNGSAVESLFSQLKYAVFGKLSSTNYSTARAAVIIKSNVRGCSRSNDNYRDQDLETEC